MSARRTISTSTATGHSRSRTEGLWGVAFANIERGVPLDADHEFVGNFFTLLNPYAILGGLTTLALFVTHGAVFLALKTTGDIRVRANRLAARAGLITAVVAVAFLGWTIGIRSNATSITFSILAAVSLLAALYANLRVREGWAFLGTAGAIALAVAALFIALHPDVMPSRPNPANSLTVDNASSSHYTLHIMTWVAVVFTPIVLIYQGWTYWVFRRRLGIGDIPVIEPAPSAVRGSA